LILSNFLSANQSPKDKCPRGLCESDLFAKQDGLLDLFAKQDGKNKGIAYITFLRLFIVLANSPRRNVKALAGHVPMKEPE